MLVMSKKSDDLNQLREEINAVDTQLLELINQRAQIARRIGGVKAEHGLSVYDPAREGAVYERLVSLNPGPLSKGAIEDIFSSIIDACRQIQIP